MPKKVFSTASFQRYLKGGNSHIILGAIAGAIIIGGIATLGATEAAKNKVEEPTQASTTTYETLPETHVVQQKTYKVTKVVDGDTIDIDMDGKTQRIRLIGVNTPETVHPEKTVECFGEEASKFTKSKLTDKEVSIETDDSQDKYDKYNRLLAYVFLDGENFNQSLIKNGYAYEYTYNVPYKYQKEFKAAQKYAEENNIGLWAPNACKTEAKKEETKKDTSNCDIKGNISSKGEKIYHVKGQKYYNSTKIDTSKGERWFCSEEEAKKAGWRKSKV